MALSSRKQKAVAASSDRDMAVRLANSAEFGLALELLESDDTVDAALLEARVALRMSDSERAIQALNKVHAATEAQRDLAMVLRSVATARLAKNYQEIVVPSAASESTRLLALYYRGSHQAKYDLWEESKASAVPVAGSNDPGIRCLGLLLQAYNEIHDQRYDHALLRFDAAYSALSEADENDEAVRTAIAFGVASLAVETFDASMFGRSVELLSTLVPTKWTARRAADALSFGSQIYDLMGDFSKAYAMLLRARAVAPAASLMFASIEIDLASSMERNSAPQVAALHRESAKQILFSSNWDTKDVDDRIVLLDYAVGSHITDQPGASRALTLALSRNGKRDQKFFFEHDGRFAILADFAKGLLLAHRDIEKSVEVIVDCQERWLAIGYRRRAVDAGLALLRLGYSDGLETLTELLRIVPKSAQRNALKAIERHPSSLLSPAEFRVAEYICEGLTSRQIADRLNRSPATIRVQTISIYRRLGVNTRSALVSLLKDAGAV